MDLTTIELLSSKPTSKLTTSNPNKCQISKTVANLNIKDIETGMVIFEDHEAQYPNYIMMNPEKPNIFHGLWAILQV